MENCKLFHYSISPERLWEAFDSLTSDGKIDFGLLDESSQKRVVLRVISSGRDSAALIRINPFLAAPGIGGGQTELIGHNRQAILDCYSQKSYRDNLLNIYCKVGTTPVKQEIDKTILVASFLNPDKFSLLKWGAYEDEK